MSPVYPKNFTSVPLIFHFAPKSTIEGLGGRILSGEIFDNLLLCFFDKRLPSRISFFPPRASRLQFIYRFSRLLTSIWVRGAIPFVSGFATLNAITMVPFFLLWTNILHTYKSMLHVYLRKLIIELHCLATCAHSLILLSYNW